MILDINPAEIRQISASAMQGNWIPLGIVVVLIGVIIFLIVRQNDSKHNATEKMLAKLTDSQVITERILAVHENEINHLKETA